VTVVLYKVMQTLNLMDEISAGQIILGIVKFFVVCIGGLLIGALFGIITALVTRVTKHVGGNFFSAEDPDRVPLV
jgi:NhaP-type Na+/H+ or K+/H+ antiporter